MSDIFGPEFNDYLLLHQILQLDRLEGADFKYNNSFLKFQPENQKYPNKAFLV